MPRAFTPKVVTANALLEGDAVWLTEENTWTRSPSPRGRNRWSLFGRRQSRR